MSEVMALESLVEELLRFEGYWTHTRVPFKKRRGNSDLDVIAVNPRGRVVVAECKGFGSPWHYPSYDTPAQRRRMQRLCQKAKNDWQYFLRSHANERLRLRQMNEFRLVLPGKLCAGKPRKSLERRLRRKCGIPVRLFAIHEIILELRARVKEDMGKTRKRYAHPALEMLRWIHRAGLWKDA